MVSPTAFVMFAQSTADIGDKFGSALTIILMLAYLSAVVILVSAGMDYRRGDTDQAKSKVIAAMIIAGAPTIVGVLFSIFGLDNAIIHAH